MATDQTSGLLASWHDMHDALRGALDELVKIAEALTPGDAALADFADRWYRFANELRLHSQVEDGILFAALSERGVDVATSLGADHRSEQQIVLEIGALLLRARVVPELDGAVDGIGDRLRSLRGSLAPHLTIEEDDVLPKIPSVFSDAEQDALFAGIIGSIPPDPQQQAWVAESLTPERRAERLRRLAASLDAATLTAIVTSIRDHASPTTWQDIEARVPGIVAMVS